MRRVWANATRHADLQAFRDFGLEVQTSQFHIERMPAAIKIDLQMPVEAIHFAKQSSVPIVLDGMSLLQERRHLTHWLSLADLLVLDTHDAELILGYRIVSHQSMEQAASELLDLGCQAIFLLGGHVLETWSHDYWSNGSISFWLTQRRLPSTPCFESRSILSSAITASFALGYPLEDAVIVAKMYVRQAIRRAEAGLDYGGFPEDDTDLPYLASMPLFEIPQPFNRCHRLGLYPIVDSADWVEFLLRLGVNTLQLRIKKRTDALEKEIQRSINLAKRYRATLYINDYWELALKLNADGVHLGQSDLDTADIGALKQKGLLLGISTHCYHEVARAHAINPSYIAIGPIYPTKSKEMPFLAQGIEHLKCWRRTLKYPLVAIGGIDIDCISDVVASGVQGIALISAITNAHDPKKATEQLLHLIEKEGLSELKLL